MRSREDRVGQDYWVNGECVMVENVLLVVVSRSAYLCWSVSPYLNFVATFMLLTHCHLLKCCCSIIIVSGDLLSCDVILLSLLDSSVLVRNCCCTVGPFGKEYVWGKSVITFITARFSASLRRSWFVNLLGVEHSKGYHSSTCLREVVVFLV